MLGFTSFNPTYTVVQMMIKATISYLELLFLVFGQIVKKLMFY